MAGKRVLFVCVQNEVRSPKAAEVFAELAAETGYSDAFEIKSAGTDAAVGRTQITEDLGFWADEIYALDGMVALVLEKRYEIQPEKIENLQVPDGFRYDDPRLTTLLREQLRKYVVI